MGWPTTGPVGQSAGGGNIALSADRSLMAAEGAATIESGLRGVFRRPRMASRTGETRRTRPAGRYLVVEDQPAQKIVKTPAQKMMPPRVGEMGMRIVPATNPPYPISRARTAARSRRRSRETSPLATADNPPLGHPPGIQNPVQLRLRENPVLEGHLTYRLAGLIALFGDLRGAVIADDRGQRRAHREGLLDQLGTARLVCTDTHQALVDEDPGGAREQGDGLQERMSHNRHHHVQLEVPSLAPDGDAGVIADHLGRHLDDSLGDDRIDLARHDGGARLNGGKHNLAEAATGTRPEPA